MSNLPTTLQVKFKYVGVYNIDNTSVPSPLEYKVIRVNSLYDPDYSGGGE